MVQMGWPVRAKTSLASFAKAHFWQPSSSSFWRYSSQWQHRHHHHYHAITGLQEWKLPTIPLRSPVYISSLSPSLQSLINIHFHHCRHSLLRHDHRYSSRSFSCQGQPILWLFWISRYCRLKFLLSPHFHFHERNWRLKFNFKAIFKSLIVFTFPTWNIYSCFLLIWRSW